MGASLSALSHFGIPVIIQDIQVIRPLKHYEGLHPKLESVGENTKKKNPQIMITDDSSGKVTCNWKSRTWCRKPPMKMVCYIVSSRPGKLRIDFAKPKQNHSEEEPAEISITASGKIWALRTMGFQWNATRGLKKLTIISINITLKNVTLSTCLFFCKKQLNITPTYRNFKSITVDLGSSSFKAGRELGATHNIV